MKIVWKLRNENIIPIFKWILLTVKLSFHWYIVCRGRICHSKIFGGEERSTLSHLRLLFCKIVYCETDKDYLLTNWLAYLYERIQSPRPDVMPDRREFIAWLKFQVFSPFLKAVTEAKNHDWYGFGPVNTLSARLIRPLYGQCTKKGLGTINK